MDEVRKAYLAGYFDADGCASVDLGERNSVRVRARIAGRDSALLEGLKFMYGGHFSHRHRASGAGENYSIWEWSVRGQRAIPFLENILPYLRLKKRQVELALEIARTMGTGGGIPVSDDVKIHRAELALEICWLNQANRSNPKETKTIKRLQEVTHWQSRDRE